MDAASIEQAWWFVLHHLWKRVTSRPTSNIAAGFFVKRTFSKPRLDSTVCRMCYVQYVPSCNWAGLSQSVLQSEAIGPEALPISIL